MNSVALTVDHPDDAITDEHGNFRSPTFLRDLHDCGLA